MTIEEARRMLTIQKVIQVELENLADADGRLENMGDAEANDSAPASVLELVKEYSGSHFTEDEITAAMQASPEMIYKALTGIHGAA